MLVDSACIKFKKILNQEMEEIRRSCLARALPYEDYVKLVGKHSGMQRALEIFIEQDGCDDDEETGP